MALRVSIIIPVEPGRSVDAVLERLSQVRFPAESIEVIVAEGRMPSRQRNDAVKDAGGDVLYFLDSDAYATERLLEETMPLYEDPRVAIVGGPNLAPDRDALLQRMFDAVQGSFLGSYLVRSRYRQIGVLRDTSEKELILCNLSFRRQVFTDFRGFDERLYPNEENELMNRVKAAGYRLLYQPTAVVYRRRRESIGQFIVQNFRYGRGRMEQMLLRFFMSDLIHLVPAAFVAYLVTLVFARIPVWGFPLGLYAALCVLSSIMEAVRTRSPLLAPLLPVIFFLRHLAYGVGLWAGAGRVVMSGYRQSLEASRDVPTLRRVKSFGEGWRR